MAGEDVEAAAAQVSAPVLLTVAETAERLRVSESYVYDLTKARTIVPVRLGRRVLIPDTEIARLIREAMEREIA